MTAGTREPSPNPTGETAFAPRRPVPHPAPPIDGDLWAAPGSVVRIDADAWGEQLFGPQGTVQPREPAASGTAVTEDAREGCEPAARPDSAAHPRRRRASGGVALVVAILILIALGFLARGLSPPSGSGDPTGGGATQPIPGQASDGSGATFAPPAGVLGAPVPPATPLPSSTAEIEPGDTTLCPMRIKPRPHGATTGEDFCFLIG